MSLNKVITDRAVERSETPPCPTFIAQTAIPLVLNNTWQRIPVGSDSFGQNSFPYAPWDGVRVSSTPDNPFTHDYHLRMDLQFSTPLLFPKDVAIELVVLDRDTENEIARFARDTLPVNSILNIPMGGGVYNAQYQISPFFVAPNRLYEIQARVDTGNLTIQQVGLSITRNN